MEKIKCIFPGLLVCIMVAIVGIVLGQFFPNIGSGLFAVLIGILIGNLNFGSSPVLKPRREIF